MKQAYSWNEGWNEGWWSGAGWSTNLKSILTKIKSMGLIPSIADGTATDHHSHSQSSHQTSTYRSSPLWLSSDLAYYLLLAIFTV